MPPSTSSPVLAIVGPTASGKSELALFLASRLNGEIVNCDSVQVYQELNIGSAKTPALERRDIPHHLIDVLPWTEELTAGAYSQLAREAIRGIYQRQKLPITVGGTGLYLRALFEGLSPIPTRNEALRDRLEAARRRYPGVLHRLLRRLDPESAARIHRNDAQKLIRAIEISCIARRPASSVQARPREAFDSVRLLKIGLSPNRTDLVDRLNQRTERMFQVGLVDETRRLLQLQEEKSIPRSLLSLGYRQTVAYIQDRCTLPQAIEETKVKTRQYVKRQLTWFRADASIRWIDDFGSSRTAQQVALAWATQFLGAIPGQTS